MWPRCVSTVLRVTNRACAISGLLGPRAASSATRQLGRGRAARRRLRSGSLDRPPAARSSVRARSVSAPAPRCFASRRPSSSGPRASARRLLRRRAAPRSTRVRAYSSRAGDSSSTPVASRRPSTVASPWATSALALRATPTPLAAPQRLASSRSSAARRRASSFSPSEANASAAWDRHRHDRWFAPPQYSLRPGRDRAARQTLAGHALSDPEQGPYLGQGVAVGPADEHADPEHVRGARARRRRTRRPRSVPGPEVRRSTAPRAGSRD